MKNKELPVASDREGAFKIEESGLPTYEQFINNSFDDLYKRVEELERLVEILNADIKILNTKVKISKFYGG